MPSTYNIAFWNLENLFDIENSPRRTDKLQRAIGADVAGWTQQLLDRKVNQLTTIIRQMKNGAGPDMLGVCEVENAHVMGLLAQSLNAALPGRNYTIAHHDTDDQRGIDVAFIYDKVLFSVKKNAAGEDEIFSHFVLRRTATRDLLQVNFLTRSNRLLVVVGNHWPSRSGGEQESAGYRAIAGETLAYFHERILEVHGAATPVLAMGDFNDEPFDPSISDFALAIRSRKKVTFSIKVSRFLNLMWPIMGRGIGSFYFDNSPNLLDQFLANENLLKDISPMKVDEASVDVFRPAKMVTTGRYPAPKPFGGMGKPVDENGFSDHFPVVVTVTEG